MARIYAGANAQLGRSWYDYGEQTLFSQFFHHMNYADNFRIEWSSPERYEIVDRVGGGKYSEVRICRPIPWILSQPLHRCSKGWTQTRRLVSSKYSSL
jgi:hypothetical protein